MYHAVRVHGDVRDFAQEHVHDKISSSIIDHIINLSNQLKFPSKIIY